MSTDSRMRMVQSAAVLISTRGVSATSFSEVLADSGAPRGSIYYHFPEGKKQLAEAAMTWTSDRILAHQRACPATTPAGILRHFIGLWRQGVLASGGRSGCAVAGVAIDTDAGDAADLLGTARLAFGSWIALLAEQLAAAGVPPGRATPIAVATVAGLEGALMLCRAEGGSAPLEVVAGELLRLVPAEAAT
jgi:AcrR family transcriptional regulator